MCISCYENCKITCESEELESTMDKARGTVSLETKANITPVSVDGRIVSVTFISQSSALSRLSVLKRIIEINNPSANEKLIWC